MRVVRKKLLPRVLWPPPMHWGCVPELPHTSDVQVQQAHPRDDRRVRLPDQCFTSTGCHFRGVFIASDSP